MRDLVEALGEWRDEGLGVALARVVGLRGSGPRDPGAAMAVNERGEVIGSVSGGCVEGAVVTEALDVLRTGACRAVSFGYSDDDAFAVGLTCGGTIELFLSPLGPAAAPVLDGLAASLRAERPAGLATVISGPGKGSEMLVRPGVVPVGSLGNPALDRVVARDVLGELTAGTTVVRHYGPAGETRQVEVSVYIQSFTPPPHMVVFGAVDFSAALVRMAKVLGYRVTVCDAREVFATPQRFPQADEVVVDWPHRLLERLQGSLSPRDAVCVLTHDAKFDVPALMAALATSVGYIGVMGSRRTQADRAARLVAEGVDEQALARVRGPIGLDIGARTPEETAVAICAEIIAARAGKTEVVALRDTTGPIHVDP